MKLLKIEGRPYEVTVFQECYEPRQEKDFKELDERSIDMVRGYKDFCRLCVRMYSDYKIRTKGYAWIEIKPMINEYYCIYLDKKGFYCNVQKHKVYLKDIDYDGDKVE